MWSSIANLKSNLNKISLDVHDEYDYDEEEDEEVSIYNSRDREDSSVSDRQISHSFAHSKSPSFSSNGFDSAYNSEIEPYKVEIKRLQESETEIKALSVNYAALLKEKEDQISRLNKENGSLKQSLDATNATLNGSRNESFNTSMNSSNVLKGSDDQSPDWRHKAVLKKHPIRSPAHNGVITKQDGSNGISHSDIQGHDKEVADMLEEKNRSLAAMQESYELRIKQLGMELDKEHKKLVDMKLRLQEEQKLNGSFQEELNSLIVDKDKTILDMNKIHDELNTKQSEIERLQMELNRKDNEQANDTAENLKRVITTLEKENSYLKVEKDKLMTALRVASSSSAERILPGSSKTSNKQSNSLSEKVESLGGFDGKEKLERDLKEARQERDKALQELNRLKQHLLDKEFEESEKMDDDDKIIEELREQSEYQKARILHLEKALNQAIISQEEIKMVNNNELQKSKEIIDDLKRKLASCMSTIDAKNVEVLNLQTALGQYYAEIEAKEHLGEDLALAREELARRSELLKDAYQQAEISKREKEELLSKLSRAEKMIAEGKNRMNKLEEDNEKLRRAIEQSMTRLNRMSMDSDFLVDRRIVIKLLVTYFQRNHSKEVLDLMVRMLGFSDEDKQRIGLAQKGAGKGVVRGVLGLPGRLVGGILGGNPAEVPGHAASENQSFTDLWVDFLLKENEKRESRESVESANESKGDQRKGNPDTTGTASPPPNQRENTTGFPRSNPFLNQSPPSSHGNLVHSEHSYSEFSTVPLTSSGSNSQISRLLPRY